MIRLPALPFFQRLYGHGRRTALVSPDRKTGKKVCWSYRDLLQGSSILSSKLLGDKAGGWGRRPLPRVVMLSPRDHHYPMGQLATWQAGGVFLPIHTKYPVEEVGYIIRDSGAKHALVHRDYRHLVDPLRDELGLHVINLDITRESIQKSSVGGQEEVDIVQVSEDTDAMIIYTSGTTGRPKGVVMTHANLQHMITALIDAWGYNEGDRILHLLPLHHLHGVLNKLLCVMWAGGVIELTDDTKAKDIWQRMASKEEDELTLFMAVPTIYSLLVEELESSRLDDATKQRGLEAMRKLRLMVSGSAPLPQTLFRKWESLTGHRLLERYGMTELGMALTNPAQPVEGRLPGYVGRPLRGVKTRIVHPDSDEEVPPGEPGELRVKGPNVFREYHGRPEVTADTFDSEGWFKTGDMAIWDSQVNSYKLLGRMSADIIKSAGYKISALDIETVILEHPQVAEACVLGKPHEKWGESVMAILRMKDDVEKSLELEELQSFLAPRLAKYKIPTVLEVVKDIPKNALGKINKKTVLRDLQL